MGLFNRCLVFMDRQVQKCFRGAMGNVGKSGVTGFVDIVSENFLIAHIPEWD